jgi:serine/threonine-protein kinase SRPK3
MILLQYVYMSDMSNESSDNPVECNDELIGTLINKKYVIIYMLGKGSFSVVWLVYNLKSKDFYALKMHEYDENEVANNEIELLKILKNNNSNLNTMIEHFIYNNGENTSICIVLPLMAGSMYDIMKFKKYTKGFPLNIVKKIMYQTLVAMKKLTNELNIIHTDIKPDNILLMGTNNKICEIIKQFNKNKFDLKIAMCKKNKLDIEECIQNYVLNLECVKSYLDNNSTDTDTCNDNDDNNNDNNKSQIDDKYMDIANIKIKLSDFGSHLKKENIHYNIQTLYYRAPEVILKYDINEKCDMWSLGCTLYELLTNKILFNPDKTDKLSRERNHLRDMYSILGKIPDYLLDNSKKYFYFYTKNRLLKGIERIEYIGLSNILYTNIKGINSEEFGHIIDLLYKLLEYDPNKRMSIDECINHPFFEIKSNYI